MASMFAFLAKVTNASTYALCSSRLVLVLPNSVIQICLPWLCAAFIAAVILASVAP